MKSADLPYRFVLRASRQASNRDIKLYIKLDMFIQV